MTEQTQPTDAELMPCPFCGASASVDDDFGKTWWVQCHGGQHTDGMLYETRAQAVAAWNTRTPQPTQAQAGAVPLTPLSEKFIEMMRPFMVEPAAFEAGIRFAERAHGIKGADHAS